LETEIQQPLIYHGVRVTEPKNEKLNWCTENFGGFNTSRCLLKGSYLYFKNEEDFTWYILRWG